MRTIKRPTRDGGVAWHYTTGDCFRRIAVTGMILPATAYVPRRERPVVWFTAAETFEPTACKNLLRPDGSIESLGIEDTARLGGGLVRLGVDTADLVPWIRLPTVIRMKPKHAEILERIAREKGSDPSRWYGSLEPVAVESCAVEVLHEGTWVRVKGELPT